MAWSKQSVKVHADEGQGSEVTIDKATQLVQQHVHRKWQSYLWDTLDKSPEERKFLFKLDFALLTFASLGI